MFRGSYNKKSMNRVATHVVLHVITLVTFTAVSGHLYLRSQPSQLNIR